MSLNSVASPGERNVHLFNSASALSIWSLLNTGGRHQTRRKQQSPGRKLVFSLEGQAVRHVRILRYVRMGLEAPPTERLL